MLGFVNTLVTLTALPSVYPLNGENPHITNILCIALKRSFLAAGSLVLLLGYEQPIYVLHIYALDGENASPIRSYRPVMRYFILMFPDVSRWHLSSHYLYRRDSGCFTVSRILKHGRHSDLLKRLLYLLKQVKGRGTKGTAGLLYLQTASPICQSMACCSQWPCLGKLHSLYCDPLFATQAIVCQGHCRGCSK